MSALTESARGRQCTVNVPGVCNYRPETVVAAHLNGAGMGIKHDDMASAFSCSACHHWLDGGWAKAAGATRELRDLYHLQAILRTQAIWRAEGLILIAGEF